MEEDAAHGEGVFGGLKFLGFEGAECLEFLQEPAVVEIVGLEDHLYELFLNFPGDFQLELPQQPP